MREFYGRKKKIKNATKHGSKHTRWIIQVNGKWESNDPYNLTTSVKLWVCLCVCQWWFFVCLHFYANKRSVSAKTLRGNEHTRTRCILKGTPFKYDTAHQTHTHTRGNVHPPNAHTVTHTRKKKKNIYITCPGKKMYNMHYFAHIQVTFCAPLHKMDRCILL